MVFYQLIIAITITITIITTKIITIIKINTTQILSKLVTDNFILFDLTMFYST